MTHPLVCHITCPRCAKRGVFSRAGGPQAFVHGHCRYIAIPDPDGHKHRCLTVPDATSAEAYLGRLVTAWREALDQRKAA